MWIVRLICFWDCWGKLCFISYLHDSSCVYYRSWAVLHKILEQLHFLKSFYEKTSAKTTPQTNFITVFTLVCFLVLFIFIWCWAFFLYSFITYLFWFFPNSENIRLCQRFVSKIHHQNTRLWCMLKDFSKSH